MITHEEISKRAREIWEREGRPEGRDKEHWLQAEAELRRDSDGEQSQPQPSLVAHQPSLAAQSSPVRTSAAESRDEAVLRRSARRGR
jgi:Protein of unknown function (DUF2934)